MSNNYRVLTTEQADTDLDRLTAYFGLLDTKIKRQDALARAVIDLAKNWKFCPYYDRNKAVRVSYVAGWYSLFSPLTNKKVAS